MAKTCSLKHLRKIPGMLVFCFGLGLDTAGLVNVVAKYFANKMGGVIANYFCFRVRDVIRAPPLDWLQLNIMLMTLQVCASFCKLSRVLATFPFYFIAALIIYSILHVLTALCRCLALNFRRGWVISSCVCGCLYGAVLSVI